MNGNTARLVCSLVTMIVGANMVTYIVHRVVYLSDFEWTLLAVGIAFLGLGTALVAASLVKDLLDRAMCASRDVEDDSEAALGE